MSDKQAAARIIPVAIEDEVKESYLNYAMSVIVSRALPDVRDGLKPVHRRILYGMHSMGLRSDRPFKKAARIVGDVLGKFHPHGDQSVYDALVRLAQTFSLRYPVVNGQGNFGSVDGDPPAAMRYTEAKLHKVAEEILRDINKETVDFGPNYDDSDEEPLVLPGAFPFLLANGASGIAVGMATNIPPHNLREIAHAVGAMLDDPDISGEKLCEHIKGPDFPTGGTIYGYRGIRSAYLTGKGRVVVRACFTIEESKRGRDVIVVNEIPYMVNKANLITRIADLVRDRKIDGIADLRDESDRNGMRIVIELKRDSNVKVILNQLFTHTQMQVNFNVNSLALVEGRPQVLTLRDMVRHFIAHRHEVVVRRTRFDLRKAEEREHILLGLKIALDNIDEVIRIIREAADVETARTSLMATFELSERQAQAILDMRLQKLTSLETKKIVDELEEVRALIRDLRELLGSELKIRELIKRETYEIAEKFGDERRTRIEPHEIEAIDIEDLIQKETMVVLLSHRGFIKRLPYSSYKTQGRGGRGLNSSSNLRDDDFIEHVFLGSTHDHVLFFTSVGKAYYLKVHEIPEASRHAKGTHVKGLLEISADEDIASVLPLRDFDPTIHLFFATARGQVVKIKANAFINARRRGIRAVKLDDGNRLVSVLITSGNDTILLVSRQGRGLRLSETDVRPMGRNTGGVRGLKLLPQDEIAGACAAPDDGQVLLLTEYGAGKRTACSEFTLHGRGGQGMKAFTVVPGGSDTPGTGEVVAVLPVSEGNEFIAVSSQGLTVRLRAEDVSVQGRTARGVSVMNVEPPDYVVGVATIDADAEEGGDQPQNPDERASAESGTVTGEGEA
ncbi:DNA topoisomerase (ATP-hydrolyzing) subunit A [Alkalispirochaeta alkalica]|uniref:DNA topoisomerase (ATP-hydrolyzing) subunit A n=1 Tax=Alkalispirochaeta alkalica TaxID=46356 RepID=UPI00036443D4|nr:DNA topoisomerase (ATP-hydrolyzing) subunit A [Alkalispirochaeta alkalica]